MPKPALASALGSLSTRPGFPIVRMVIGMIKAHSILRRVPRTQTNPI
jgi:hypothetical protein